MFLPRLNKAFLCNITAYLTYPPHYVWHGLDLGVNSHLVSSLMSHCSLHSMGIKGAVILIKLSSVKTLQRWAQSCYILTGIQMQRG